MPKKTPKAQNLEELVKSWKTFFSPAIKHCSKLRHMKDGENTFAIIFSNLLFSWNKVSHIHATVYLFLFISLKNVTYLYIEQKWYLTSDNDHQQ